MKYADIKEIIKNIERKELELAELVKLEAVIQDRTDANNQIEVIIDRTTVKVDPADLITLVAKAKAAKDTATDFAALKSKVK